MSPRVPDVASKIEAYRIFLLDGDRLISTGLTSHAWKVGENVARCAKTKHAAPVLEHSCGFWSFKELETAKDQYRNTHTGHLMERRRCVMAKIAIWGKVIEGELGFRAQRAEVMEISAWGCTNAEAKAAAKRYGVLTGASHPMPWSSLPPDPPKPTATPVPIVPKVAVKPAAVVPPKAPAAKVRRHSSPRRQTIVAWGLLLALLFSIVFFIMVVTHQMPGFLDLQSRVARSVPPRSAVQRPCAQYTVSRQRTCAHRQSPRPDGRQRGR